jgi:hypothetical protein
MNERIRNLAAFNTLLSTVHELAGELPASVETLSTARNSVADIEALQAHLAQLLILAKAA